MFSLKKLHFHITQYKQFYPAKFVWIYGTGAPSVHLQSSRKPGSISSQPQNKTLYQNSVSDEDKSET